MPKLIWRIAIALITAILLAGCISTAPRTRDWAMFRANLQRNGVNDTKGVQQVTELKWKVKIGDSVFFSSPVIVDGVIYVASVNGRLYALDADTGRENWNFNVGGVLYEPPAVANGVAYVGSDNGYLYAVDLKTRQERWKFKAEQQTAKPIGPIPVLDDIRITSPAIVEGMVFFGSGWLDVTRTKASGHFYAVDANTGDEKWEIKTQERADSSSAVVDGVAYFSSLDGTLYAMDTKTGRQQWKLQAAYIPHTPVIADGVVYFVTEFGVLYAIDTKTRHEKWNFKPGKGGGSSPAIASGVAFFGTNDGNLYAVDLKTSQEKWRFKTANEIHSDPAIAEGVVYFGGTDGYLYAVDEKTGQEKWKFKTGGPVDFAVVADGVVYFGSRDGFLYAVR